MGMQVEVADRARAPLKGLRASVTAPPLKGPGVPKRSKGPEFGPIIWVV